MKAWLAAAALACLAVPINAAERSANRITEGELDTMADLCSVERSSFKLLKSGNIKFKSRKMARHKTFGCLLNKVMRDYPETRIIFPDKAPRSKAR
ncbi:hypothetical protein [Rhizorhabdus argentea]|uniref:hypothetical protein n=1 Tax=Rhizorhabdus argentea TaxID=1387174 RepID=UPI0030EF0F6F